ncbi:glycosyltransferase family 2 protein [Patescibacteria group bacterium]|nr:glycosyltransferase family 2 protein [Patescibacteria group bacterium]MCG2701951.1 glycosyltransferase family 2 protein [Candidatus Parcubacteria bacterium]MBU4265154.1 glycosyltransferase family 2 protein [Patescibacteria group bacterium]MBU4390718.1 glycosyltransferase family 2 protein [Patescibacteria group bacterium]MBU4397123.1 glycosyltransferase family 2 protein [Patescibacteria group bacterium]
MTKNKTKIAIIVLNWNQPALTIQTIKSLLKIKHTSFNYKIFLVDNASTDNSIELFNKFTHRHPDPSHRHPDSPTGEEGSPRNRQKQQRDSSASPQNDVKIQILQTSSNLGYANGNNFGIKQALKENFDYILVINNDVLVDPDFLQILLKSAQKNPKLAILGPKIYFAKGYEFHKNRYKKNELGNIIWSAGGYMDWDNILGSNIGVDQIDKGQFNKFTTKIDFISGCCMLVKSKLFKEIGLFDKKYFMYLEDIDFCQKAKKAGYKLAYIPDSKIWHLNAQSSGTGGNLHHYFISRNRLLFAMRHASFRVKLAIIRQSVEKLFSSKYSWEKRGIIDFYLQRFNKGRWK